MILLAESAGDPAALIAPLRDVVRTLDASQPIYNVRTMQEFYQISTIGMFNVIIGTVAAMGVMGSSGRQIDRLSLLLVAPAVFAVTAIAAYLPAQRAARIDPIVALRYE